jgi:hypothetical protein
LWDAGEVVRDRSELGLPVDILPGQYELTVGLYDPVTSERLATSGAEGHPATNNAIHLTTVEVR